MVLFNTNVNDVEGTGYIVSLNTIITPTVNLKNFFTALKFKIHKTLGQVTYGIYTYKKQDDLMSIAYVSSYTPKTCYYDYTKNEL